jgi:hypothetical protein
MSRAKFDTKTVAPDLIRALSVLRGALDLSQILGLPNATDTTAAELEEALIYVETYAAISLDVLSRTNPSKVQAAAKNAELRTLISPGVQK